MKMVEGDIVVCVDGKACPDCFAYDNERGLARCYERKHGRLVMDGEHRPKTVQLTGAITIKSKKEAEAHESPMPSKSKRDDQ